VVVFFNDEVDITKAICKDWGLDVTVRVRKEGETHPQDWGF
jgi:hypothetical protein